MICYLSKKGKEQNNVHSMISFVFYNNIIMLTCKQKHSRRLPQAKDSRERRLERRRLYFKQNRKVFVVVLSDFTLSIYLLLRHPHFRKCPDPSQTGGAPLCSPRLCHKLLQHFSHNRCLTCRLPKLLESSFEGRDWFLFLRFQHLVECLTHSNRLIKFAGREGGKKGGKEEGRERESYMKINQLAVYTALLREGRIRRQGGLARKRAMTGMKNGVQLS